MRQGDITVMRSKAVKIIKRTLAVVLCVGMILPFASTDIKAETFWLQNNRRLDTIWYANYYPDLKAKYGYDTQKLLNHYLNYGIYERRLPSKYYFYNMDLLSEPNNVSPQRLYQRKYLAKNTTYDEFRAAYFWANNRVTNFARAASQTNMLVQMGVVANRMHDIVCFSPGVNQSTSTAHYNDPCGVFGVVPPTSSNAGGDNFTPLGASSAGVARAVGLCLNMLTIPYEHVNANTWKQQFVRVNYNQQYYIIDPYLSRPLMRQEEYVMLYGPFMPE